MSTIAAAVRAMLARGVDHETIVVTVSEMEAASDQSTARQARNRRYYETHPRLKPSEKRLNSDAQATVLKPSETVLNRLNSDAQKPIYNNLTSLVLEDNQKDSQSVRTRPGARSMLNGHQTEFDRWYAIYPRKESRGAAEKAFVSAIKITDIETLIRGVRAYAKIAETKERQYVKQPATWLNQKCWLDEPETTRRSGGVY